MKTYRYGVFSFSSVIGMCMMYQSAMAVPVTLVQDYAFPGKVTTTTERFANTLITATVRYDDGSLTGIGSEFIAAASVDLLFTNRGISGLTAGIDLATPVLSALPGSINVDDFKVQYVDGIFEDFGFQAGGGSVQFALFNGGIATIRNLITFLGGPGGVTPNLIVTTSGSVNNTKFEFDTFGEATLTRDVSLVPLPAALPLYATGLALLGLFGWRRKRMISAQKKIPG